jgi:hypothetical protein
MSTFVLFIGGYGAKISDIELWKSSATGQRAGVTFDGFPWPPSAQNGLKASALSAFKAAKTMPEAIKKIMDSKCDEVFIVGHSSGCAIANSIEEELVGALGKNSTVTVHLVALDGFRPSDAQFSRSAGQIWCADDSKDASNTSLNYTSVTNVKGFQTYHAQGCTNVWSLHFSLVNTAISDKTMKGFDDLHNGYLNCRANLCWLPAALASTQSPAAPATPAKAP